MKSNSIYSNFNKKAFELSMAKVISILIMLVVMAIVLSQVGYFKDTSFNGISDFKLKSIIEKCEIYPSKCDIKYCSDELTGDDKCSENEQNTWNSLNNYYEKCSNQGDMSDEDYKKLNCGVLNSEIRTLVVKGATSFERGSLDPNPNTNPGTDINTIKQIKKGTFFESSFYKSYSLKFETYAGTKNIDVNLIYAILIKEDGYWRNFENSVRFECHVFNRINGNLENMPCTFKNGEVFSRVRSETDYSAFIRASNLDPNLAFKSSSFGFAQIMGSNILRYEPGKTSKKIISILSDEKMIDYFFDFLNENSIDTYLSNKNFAKIARAYNGPKYAQNKYDTDLKKIYEGLA